MKGEVEFWTVLENGLVCVIGLDFLVRCRDLV